MKTTSRIRRTTFTAATFFTLTAVAVAPIATAQQSDSKEIIERFCKMDAEGKQLSPEGQKEMTPFLSGQRPQAEFPEIIVVKDYVVRAQEIRGDMAQIVVDYNVWGRLDSSLRFTSSAGTSVTQPVGIAESISVIRSDKHFELGSDGRWQEVQGSPEWRIKTLPSTPHISVRAAIRYVREQGYRSRDPLIRKNAQSTFANLTALLRVPSGVASEPPQQSPTAVLSQYVAMETDGMGLTANGRKQLDAFLVQPTPWRSGKIHVVGGSAVSNAVFLGSKGSLYVEYIALGELDSSLRFTSSSPAWIKVREEYGLVQSNKYSLPGYGGKPAQELIGPNRWKVEDAHQEQWITVNAAIRYVTEMLDKTTDVAVKKNAEAALVVLKRVQ